MRGRFTAGALLALAITTAGFAQNKRDDVVRTDRENLQSDPHWVYNDFDAAIGEAKRTGKPMFVVFR